MDLEETEAIKRLTEDKKLSDLENKLKILQLQEQINELKKNDRVTLQVAGDTSEYKKELCLSYLENNGKCTEGMGCMHAHGTVELREENESIMDYLDRYLQSNTKIEHLKLTSKAFAARL